MQAGSYRNRSRPGPKPRLVGAALDLASRLRGKHQTFREVAAALAAAGHLNPATERPYTAEAVRRALQRVPDLRTPFLPLPSPAQRLAVQAYMRRFGESPPAIDVPRGRHDDFAAVLGDAVRRGQRVTAAQLRCTLSLCWHPPPATP